MTSSTDSSTVSPSVSPAITFSYNSLAEVQIPAALKFLMNNIKNIVQNPLTTENNPTCRAQVVKVFQANGFSSFLDGSIPAPNKHIVSLSNTHTPNPANNQWDLIDQNITAALYSIISTSLLPYVLNLNNCHEVWTTLDKRLQSTNRSRIFQLKNELHHLTMKDMSMIQYLSIIKAKVDAIATAGSSIDTNYIILYTLNGLPATYNAFKTSIRTKLHPIHLDDVYVLLCNEEINLAAKSLKEAHIQDTENPPTALTSVHGRGRGRSYAAFFVGTVVPIHTEEDNQAEECAPSIEL
ncbi:uncharacterized protein LOC110097465 [Dendrobium catenatum]|uniref:uncharacterized protein LOC110097465 n=1 Tax=Dendrobium catenatum TaxID=906689 RepID=UPI0009F50CA6|nr:uncharacterized protein LOC110097465 [Dendrobium catenatum]